MKPLKINKAKLFYLEKGEKVFGPNPNMIGDPYYLIGDCSGLSGDCTRLSGDCTWLIGDCARLSGYCTGLSGDLNEITQAQRKINSDISYYIEEE